MQWNVRLFLHCSPKVMVFYDASKPTPVGAWCLVLRTVVKAFRAVPQGLKPFLPEVRAARLKPCPDTKPEPL
jgi:hypothetical protein